MMLFDKLIWLVVLLVVDVVFSVQSFEANILMRDEEYVYLIQKRNCKEGRCDVVLECDPKASDHAKLTFYCWRIDRSPAVWSYYFLQNFGAMMSCRSVSVTYYSDGVIMKGSCCKNRWVDCGGTKKKTQLLAFWYYKPDDTPTSPKLQYTPSLPEPLTRPNYPESVTQQPLSNYPQSYPEPQRKPPQQSQPFPYIPQRPEQPHSPLIPEQHFSPEQEEEPEPFYIPEQVEQPGSPYSPEQSQQPEFSYSPEKPTSPSSNTSVPDSPEEAINLLQLLLNKFGFTIVPKSQDQATSEPEYDNVRPATTTTPLEEKTPTTTTEESIQKQPEATQTQPEATQKQPEATQKQPEDTTSKPDDSPKLPEEFEIGFEMLTNPPSPTPFEYFPFTQPPPASENTQPPPSEIKPPVPVLTPKPKPQAPKPYPETVPPAPVPPVETKPQDFPPEIEPPAPVPPVETKPQDSPPEIEPPALVPPVETKPQNSPLEIEPPAPVPSVETKPQDSPPDTEPPAPSYPSEPIPLPPLETNPPAPTSKPKSPAPKPYPETVPPPLPPSEIKPQDPLTETKPPVPLPSSENRPPQLAPPSEAKPLAPAPYPEAIPSAPVPSLETKPQYPLPETESPPPTSEPRPPSVPPPETEPPAPAAKPEPPAPKPYPETTPPTLPPQNKPQVPFPEAKPEAPQPVLETRPPAPAPPVKPEPPAPTFSSETMPPAPLPLPETKPQTLSPEPNPQLSKFPPETKPQALSPEPNPQLSKFPPETKPPTLVPPSESNPPAPYPELRPPNPPPESRPPQIPGDEFKPSPPVKTEPSYEFPDQNIQDSPINYPQQNNSSQTPLYDVEPLPDENPNSPEELGISAKKFTLKLMKALQNAIPNLMFSPYSIKKAIEILLQGATGPTYNKVENILGPMNNIQKPAPPPPDCIITNTLFYNNKFTVQRPFQQAAETLGTTLQPADFSREPKSIANNINRYISDSTDGQITNMVNPASIQQDTNSILCNGAYTKSNWQYPFDPYRTQRNSPFHRQQGGSIPVDMMRSSVGTMYRAGYFPQDRLSMVEIPYSDSSLCMQVYLPDESNSVEEMQNNLTPEKLQEIENTIEKREVDLSMPKFRYELKTNLKDALKNLGLEESEGNGYGGIFTKGRQARAVHKITATINQMIHASVIDMGEEGNTTTPNPVSDAFGLVPFSSYEPLKITVDRPFMFFIQDKVTKEYIFAGKIAF